ncbi:MAG: cytochrome c [Myxococcota bacterium]
MRQETLKKVLKIALVVGGVSALAPMVHAQAIGISELEDMLVPTKQKVERGEKLYEQNCAACHGDNGQGMADISMAGTDEAFQTTNFQQAEYEYGGGPIQIYNTITFGLEEALPPSERPGATADGEAADGQIPTHPVYPQLQYQSRWDIAHYVRSLGPTDELEDPQPLIDKAKERAEKGVCDPSIRSQVTERMEMRGDEQLELGEEVYAQNCASCHGDQGAGDGPAAGALNPAPRNFTTADAEWTNGTSQLAIYNTLQNGIEGTSMASYANLPDEELWAMVHYVRQWVPEEAREDVSDEQITNACRSMSKPEPPEPISTDVAITAMVKDQAEERAIRLQKHGVVQLARDADPARGEKLYVENCVSCHGVDGVGVPQKGPYGAQPPYLYLDVSRLAAASAGGTAEDFAARSIRGPHATLPDMTSASLMTRQEWEDLQAYVAEFGGFGEITYEPLPTDSAEAPAGVEEAREVDAATDSDQQQPAGDAASGQDTTQTDSDPSADQEAPAEEPAEDAPSDSGSESTE